MVMTLNSSTNDHSLCSPVTTAVVVRGSGGVNSHRSRSGLPWVQVVRGNSEAISAVPRSPSSTSTTSPPTLINATEQTTFSYCPTSKYPPENYASEAQLESKDDDNHRNVASPKRKSAWKKPLNGVIEFGVVMGGAVAWPGLLEASRPSPKSSCDSSKALSHKSPSVYQASLISHSPQKEANNNTKSNMTVNHTMPGRQRFIKHRGGIGTDGESAQSGFIRPPPPPPTSSPLMPPSFPMFEMPYGPLIPAMVDSHARESHHKVDAWGGRPMVGAGFHSHAGNDYPSARNSSGKGSFWPRFRGDGPNRHRSNHGDRDFRDVHVSSNQVSLHSGGFIRPVSPGLHAFITPPHVRPFLNSTGFVFYVPTLPLEYFGDAQPIASASSLPTYSPSWDPYLSPLLVNQIDYYFSDANLVKDDFLKTNMNDQGWVPISLIASFPRVQKLTKNIQLILDSLGASAVVEVQVDEVRKRDNWKKWIPPAVHLYLRSGSQSPLTSPKNILANSTHNLSLDNMTTDNIGGSLV